MKKKTILLFGGKSVEHDISVITALQVMKQLPQQIDCLPIYIDKEGVWWTGDNLGDVEIYSNFQKLAKKRCQVSVLTGENVLLKRKNNKFLLLCEIETVLNCCHGGCGENGSVSGLFDASNVPYTSAGVLASSLCMDKAIFKDVLKTNFIKTPEYFCVYKGEKIKKTKFPVVVKPCNLGSSIAVSFCKNENELKKSLDLAFQFDERVIIEKAVENLKEFNCACFFYRGQYFLSNVNEVDLKGDIYSFEDKYLSQDAKNKETARNLSNKIQHLTEKVYKLCLCKGVVRVDFLYDEKTETLYVNEANTIPGSLAFYLFKEIPFKELVSALLNQSLEDKSKTSSLIDHFDSSALENFKKLPQISKK